MKESKRVHKEDGKHLNFKGQIKRIKECFKEFEGRKL